MCCMLYESYKLHQNYICVTYVWCVRIGATLTTNDKT